MAEISPTEKKKFEDWLNPRLELGRSFDDVLYYNIYNINKELEKKYSVFVVIAGEEGNGKSTLEINMGTIAEYQPETKFFKFSINQICSDVKEFLTQLKEIPDGSWIGFDEAGLSLYNKEAMTRMNRLLNKIFMVTRQKRLCLMFCIPSFFMLDSYIRDHRVNLLIWIRERGNYYLWDSQRAKSLSIKGRLYKNYSAVPPLHKGYFNKPFINKDLQEAYDTKKRKHMDDFMNTVNTDEKIGTQEYVPERELMSVSEFMTRTGLSDATVRKYIREDVIKGTRVGFKYFVFKSEIDKILKNPKK